jgi:crotonobetainyl-CoA:carnitine CoA-transferase CaiB-like acyl-CoA transferase
MRQYSLSGIKVLDLTRVLAGPLCTMMLGDLGADVIKIERPGSGDDTRGWGPPFDGRGESAYFLSINRNKWSVAADLDRTDDRALIARLATTADVVVENFRPGTLERRGIDANLWLDRYPQLIWTTITGFGPGSPRVGYDFVVQAEQGWMSITGEPDGPPSKVGVALADIIAGKDAAIAILAAIAGRSRGVAHPAQRRITISLAQSAAAALVNVAQNVLVTGGDADRWGNAHPNLVPYQLFDTADRPVALAVGTDGQWQACALALDLPEMAADPTLASNAGRVTHRVRLVRALAARLHDRTAAEWLSRLDAVGVPVGLVRSVREALADVPASALTGVAPSVPGAVRYPPPLLDQHGEIVRRLGWEAFGKTSDYRSAGRD